MASKLFDPYLSFAADVLDDIEKTRIAQSNRLQILTRSTTDTDGEMRGFGLDESHPDVARLAGMVEALVTIEIDATKALQRTLRKHPLAEWIRGTKGVGEKQGARLLAAIGGDPYWNSRDDCPRTVSALWAYCGLHVLQKPIEPTGDQRSGDTQSTTVAGDRDGIDTQQIAVTGDYPGSNTHAINVAGDRYGIDTQMIAVTGDPGSRDNQATAVTGGLSAPGTQSTTATGDQSQTDTQGRYVTGDQSRTDIQKKHVTGDPGTPDNQSIAVTGDRGDPNQGNLETQVARVGVAPRRTRGVKANWSTVAKTRAHLVAESCIKQIKEPCHAAALDGRWLAVHYDECVCSPFRITYDTRKMHTGTSHPEWTDGHRHNDALRVTAKDILRCLWREARHIHVGTRSGSPKDQL